jgi:hypothetical protein
MGVLLNGVKETACGRPNLTEATPSALQYYFDTKEEKVKVNEYILLC